jgi:putative ABC transport system ATP-binding protein
MEGKPPAAQVEGLVFEWPKSLFRLEIGELTIGPGERVFLSGPSGGGKSTLLSLMAGIMAPARGSVSIGGVGLSGLSPSGRDRLRGEKTGIIFQRFNLVPYLTAIDNVLLPLRLNPGRRMAAEKAFEREAPASGQGLRKPLLAQAESLLSRLGLDESVWRRPSTTLSVGQSQRVAAARALIGRPPLILADEPTSSLDEDARVAFLRTLVHECGEAGAGLLFVSHDRRLEAEFGRAARLEKKGSATVFQEVSAKGASESPPPEGPGQGGAMP